MARLVNVIVVVHSRLFREGLRLIISGPRFAAESATASFAQALELLQTGAAQADLIIADSMPALEKESETITKLRHEFPSIKIVALTWSPTTSDNEYAARHGVSGIFSKDLSSEALKHALELVLMSGTVGSVWVTGAPRNVSALPEPMRRNGSHIESTGVGPDSPMTSLGDALAEDAAHEAEGDNPSDLSSREIQTLECLVSGMSNKLIARQLDIAEATVKVHLRSLLRKLKVQNRTQAAIWAMQNATTPPRSEAMPPQKIRAGTFTTSSGSSLLLSIA
jgi:two-component system nitrate/nitrite response regulator NarL